MSEEFEIPYYEPKYEVFQAIKLRMEVRAGVSDHSGIAMICNWANWSMGLQMDRSVVVVPRAEGLSDPGVVLPEDNDKYYLMKYTDDDEAFLMDADEFEERYARLDRAPVMEEINEPEESASYVIGSSGTYLSGTGTWTVPVTSASISTTTIGPTKLSSGTFTPAAPVYRSLKEVDELNEFEKAAHPRMKKVGDEWFVQSGDDDDPIWQPIKCGTVVSGDPYDVIENPPD